MTIYNSYRRFSLSIVVTLLLAAVFFVFRLLTSPFLDVEHTQRKFTAQDRVETASTEIVAEARKWLPDYSWVAEAKKHFQDGDRYLYCRDFNLKDNDRSMVVKPIAMILHNKSGDRPITVVADSARLDSSEPISPNSTKVGQIISGSLNGNVRIEGPRGLRIDGRSFTLSEDTMTLFSTDPVQFRMDNHHGTADSGVDIYLHNASGDGDALTDVTDVRLIRLNGRVTCEFFVPATHVDEEDQELHVKAAGGFSYEVLTKIGAFSGLKPPKGERKLRKLRNEVLVERFAAGKVTDRLVCPELMLRLRTTLPSEVELADGNSLQLEHVKAWGRQVLYKSLVHDVTVNANEIGYAVAERRIDIFRHDKGATSQSNDVQVEQGVNRLNVPHIRVLHTPAGGIQRVEFNGKGNLSGRAQPPAGPSQQKAEKPESEVAFTASWLKALTMQVASDQVTRVVSLTGGASVAETSRDFELKAETIAMKLVASSEEEEVKKHSATRKVLPVAHTEESKSSSDFDLASLRPKVMTAVGRVALKSAQGSGQLREKLTIKFEDMLAATPAKTVSNTKQESSSASEKENVSGDRISFESDTLDAIVGISVDPENTELELRNVWLNGDVEIVRQSDKADNSFTASGNQLFATGNTQENLEIKLFGDPAVLSSESRNLEGPRIDLTAVESEAKVVGSGRIEFQMEKGFDGRMLPRPTPLEIYWSDHMVFQKRSANFVGNIRVVMSDDSTQDVEITCAGLTVHFSEDVVLGRRGEGKVFEAVAAPVLSEGKKRSTGQKNIGPIERIECHNTVNVRVDQWEDEKPVGRHSAEFADLKLNMITGDFTAVGRGYMESVSPDEDGQLQGPVPVTARANTPSQTTDTAFVYLRVEFIGDLTGNLDRREANLTHNVMALVAPARHIDDEIDMDVPASELPLRAGILLSEHLTISAIEADDEADGEAADSFSITARENARLGSRMLSASGADVITYDHQKQQFIIKAEGKGTVRVNHQDSRTNKLNYLTGKRFEYYRRTDHLDLVDSGGLTLDAGSMKLKE